MPEPEPDHRGPPAAAISNAITRLYAEHHGRGAKTTHTVIQRNYVSVYLEDIYTPGERTLLEAGYDEQVKATRQAFQMAMRDRFVAAVEQITHRKVIAFMSQNHVSPDYAAEIFILEPHGTDQEPENHNPPEKDESDSLESGRPQAPSDGSENAKQ